MSKCTKVKNPCKLCYRSVSHKTGVQCKGICKKWAHYKCLNYTPGKIQDIKAGLVKITCPCPDCNSTEPKEIFVETPYGCTNLKFPTNSLPICESTECPSMYHITKEKPLMPEPSPSSLSDNIRCSVKRCEVNSKQSSSQPQPNWLAESSSFPNSLSSCCKKKVDPTQHMKSLPPRCPISTCSHTSSLKPVYSKARNKMCSPIRSLSCSFVGERSVCNACDAETAPRYASSSDSQISRTIETQKSLYMTMEEMCTTVGQLSGQLKELMCRMMEAFEKTRHC